MNITKNGENMSIAVSINSSGQATIPKAVREFLGVVPGENRLVFNFKKNTIVVGREPSRKELLEKSLKKIWKSVEKEKKQNPAFAEGYEKYKDMTFNEVREAYDATPEGEKEFEEKYGL